MNENAGSLGMPLRPPSFRFLCSGCFVLLLGTLTFISVGRRRITPVRGEAPTSALGIKKAYIIPPVPVSTNSETFSVWIEKDPKKALDSIETIADAKERERWLRRVASLTSGRDPGEAVRLVLNSVNSEPLRSESLIDLFDDWATREPADAAHYAESIPMGKDRTEALYVVADRWIKTNPTTAYIWMKGLPEFDPLISSLF